MELSKDLKAKLDGIIDELKNQKVIVAFSGGVDSSLLAFLAKKNAKETLLITERSILYPEREIEVSRFFAKNYDIPQVLIERNPLDDGGFKSNPKERCYICKKGLYEEILKIKNSKKYDLILDGSNYDDLSDYRPGMRAVEELNISTPYIDFKVYKDEIRKIAKFYGLKVQSKPSMACFSSRIPYGQSITKEKLYRIREGELFLKESFNLRQLRVRHHENMLARIEFLPNDLDTILIPENIKLIKDKFKELGFVYITIDIEGFRSGSMNEILDL